MSLYEMVDGSTRRLAVPLMGSVGSRLTEQKLGACLHDSARHLACLKALVESFAPDALFPIMDLTLEAEALGLAVAFADDEAPSVAEHPIKSYEDLLQLQVPDPTTTGRMPLWLEVIGGMRQLTDAAIACYVIGPFTLAAELVGAEDMAINTIRDRDFATAAIAFACDVICRYAEEMAQRADIVTVLEPSAVMLSSATFRDFVSGALRRLSAVITSRSASPVLHICGNTTHLWSEMAECGAEGFSLDAPVDLRAAASVVHPDQVLFGNVDPVGMMLEGDAADVNAACLTLLEKMEGVTNFVLASGCDLPADTPPANIAQLVAAVK